MKKQFFYAALAIGMMSSCSSNDLPGNQAPEEQLPEEERVAMELGIQAPASSITASTRSTGTVGGTTDETNLWNGQTLYVVAYDKGTSDKVIDSETVTEETPEGTYIFEGLAFKAPTQAIPSDDSKIRIFNDEDKIKAVYYNPTGNIDFYGYHIDDLTGTLNGYKVENITITGAQDLLGARTEAVESTAYPGAEVADITEFNTATRGFSAWAARRKIQPILNFQHLLTRFTFTVEAKEKTAAEYYWNGADAFVQNVNSESNITAVQIEEISIKDVYNNVEIILYDADEDKPYINIVGDSKATMYLKGRNVSGTSIDLSPTAAKVFGYEDSNSSSWNEGTMGQATIKTPVGESLMIPIPAGQTTLPIHIKLKQWVPDTIDPSDDETVLTWKEKSGTIDTTLDLANISGGSSTAFLAGASYAVNIQVWSFQRIEISASLEKWSNGGSFEVPAE